MAEKFVNVDNLTYCGEEANEIFVKSLYESDLKGYGLRLMPGVKGRRKIMTGEVGEMFQAYSCPFTPDGSVVISEQFIEPVELKVNLENCYSDFWDTYMVHQTEITLNGGIPQMFFEWFFNNVLVKQLKKEYEELFWNGNTNRSIPGKRYLNLADGILKKIGDEANNGNAVRIGGGELTTTNILSRIGEVANAINDLDVDTEGYKIFVNYMDYRKLVTALGTDSPLTTQVWANFAKAGEKVYAFGYEVVPCRIAKHNILATHPMNLVLGYDVADSEIQYKIIDMRESTLDNAFRVGVLTNIAIGVVYPQTCVISDYNEFGE